MTNFWRLFALNSAVLLTVLVGCGPSDGTRQFEAGEAAYARGDYAKALALYVEGLSCCSNNVNALLMASQSALALNETVEAADFAGRAANLEPDAIDVLQMVAKTSCARADYVSARRAYTRLLTKEGRTPEELSIGWAGLAVVEMMTEETTVDEARRDRARTSLLKALRYNPRNVNAVYHLGRLYRDYYGYTDAARMQFELFVRLQARQQAVADARSVEVQRRVLPELRDALNARLAARPGASKRDVEKGAEHLKKAEDARAAGRYRTAKSAYQEALQADALSYPAALGLARTIEKSQQGITGRRESWTYYLMACELRPGALKTYLTTADLALKLEKYQSAVELYSRALAADGQNRLAVDGLIRALEKSGLTSVARVYREYATFMRTPLKM